MNRYYQKKQLYLQMQITNKLSLLQLVVYHLGRQISQHYAHIRREAKEDILEITQPNDNKHI